jgi:hypothetical protein
MDEKWKHVTTLVMEDQGAAADEDEPIGESAGGARTRRGYAAGASPNRLAARSGWRNCTICSNPRDYIGDNTDRIPQISQPSNCHKAFLQGK